jgi:hypothetical protein
MCVHLSGRELDVPGSPNLAIRQNVYILAVHPGAVNTEMQNQWTDVRRNGDAFRP